MTGSATLLSSLYQKTMKNVRVFLQLCRMNFSLMLIYRVSFVISLVLMVFWVFAFTLLVEVIFLHTDTLAGWGKGEVLLILGFYYLLQNIGDIFYKDNFERFGLVLRRGEFDFAITKPVSSRVLSFFRIIRFDHAAGLFVTATLFIYALKNISEPVSWYMLFFGFLFSIVASVLYYYLLTLVAVLAFFIEKNETFNVLIWNVSQVSRYPRQIYRAFIGKILTFFIPLALLATLPAEVAIQFQNGALPWIFIILVLVFAMISHVFWKLGVKHYRSAA